MLRITPKISAIRAGAGRTLSSVTAATAVGDAGAVRRRPPAYSQFGCAPLASKRTSGVGGSCVCDRDFGHRHTAGPESRACVFHFAGMFALRRSGFIPALARRPVSQDRRSALRCAFLHRGNRLRRIAVRGVGCQHSPQCTGELVWQRMSRKSFPVT